MEKRQTDDRLMSDKGRLIIEHLYQNRDYAWISRTRQGANDIRPNNLVLIAQVWPQQRDVAPRRRFKYIETLSVPLPQLFYDGLDLRGRRYFVVYISMDKHEKQVEWDDYRQRPFYSTHAKFPNSYCDNLQIWRRRPP